MKYLVGVSVYGEAVHVAGEYIPSESPTTSGIYWFVLEADSEDEAKKLGQKNWENFKKASQALDLLTYEIRYRFKVLGFHEQ